MGLWVYVDGDFVPEEEAKVSVFDHGYLYGDGVFEGIRAYNGRVFRLTEHLERLYDSARAIMLQIPVTVDEMQEIVLSTLRRNGLRDTYIRLVVSRGVGDLGLDPRKCKEPTVVVIADKIALYPEEMYEHGLELITVPTRRNVPEAVNPMIKSLNYLNNILAKIEAGRAGVPEAIMLNVDGYVAECTGDNVFILKDGVLMTPPSHIGALKGITRQVAIDLAREVEIPTTEALFTRYDLYVADEVFLTGTAAEIIPAVEVDGRVIGDGTPGENTVRLMGMFRELTEAEGVPIDAE